MSGGSVMSPCINVCVIDAANGYCLGCRRTREEIERWPQMSADEQRELLRRLAARQPDASGDD